MFKILGDFNEINEEFDEKQFLSIDNSLDEYSKKLLLSLTTSHAQVLCVTNEVGFGVIPPTFIGRIFRDYLGQINQKLAQIADRALLVVAGKVIELQ